MFYLINLIHSIFIYMRCPTGSPNHHATVTITIRMCVEWKRTCAFLHFCIFLNNTGQRYLFLSLLLLIREYEMSNERIIRGAQYAFIVFLLAVKRNNFIVIMSLANWKKYVLYLFNIYYKIILQFVFYNKIDLITKI